MKDISRRDFFKLAGTVAAGAAIAGIGGIGSEALAPKEAAAEAKAKVYFTKHIDAEHLLKLYDRVNSEIRGKVAIKLHTGEPHGPNILPRDMVQRFQGQIPNSAIIEANVAYGGPRADTQGHRETLKVNGWTFCPVDIIDADGDVNFPVKDGFHLKEVAMGKHLTNYDSLVVLTHFNEQVK